MLKKIKRWFYKHQDTIALIVFLLCCGIMITLIYLNRVLGVL